MPSDNNLSYSEISAIVARLLSVDSEIGEDENLMELGLTSIKTMEFVNEIRKKKIRVSFSELVKKCTLKNWYEIIQAKHQKGKTMPGFVSSELVREVPFGLTDVQSAYLIGRDENQTLGGVGCHAYLEFECGEIDTERLGKAWEDLLNHHPMLQIVFTDTASQFYPEEPASNPMIIKEFISDEEERFLQYRKEVSHRKLEVEKGKNAGLTLCVFKNGKSRLLLDVDLLVADVESLAIIIRDLGTLYNGGSLPEHSSKWDFNQYLCWKQKTGTAEYEKAKEYWSARIDSLPHEMEFPVVTDPEKVKKPFFTRRKYEISMENWEVLKKKAAAYQTTPSMVLLTAYAKVLERWSGQKKFFINIPIFNRDTSVAGIKDVVADFTTLILLEVNVEKDDSFVSLLKRLETRLYKDMKYTSFSGVEVQRMITTREHKKKNIAPFVFACNYETNLVSDIFRNTIGECTYMLSQTPQVWVDFQSYTTPNSILLSWDTVDEVLGKEFIENCFGCFKQLVGKLISDSWEQDFNVFPQEDLQLLTTYNQTEFNVKVMPLHEQFKNAAKKYPNRIAVSDGECELSYKMLDALSDSVADYLCQNKVAQGEHVGVLAERKAYTIANILGILKCGCVYVPVDPENPRSRQESILQNAQCQICLSTDIEGLYDSREVFEDREVSLDDDAYIIYTSGSTGNPKGVVITHRGAANTINDINMRYKVTEEDKIIGLSSMCFDLSVYDIFGTLAVGACLVMIPDIHDVNYIIDRMKEGITIWNSVPAIMTMTMEAIEKEEAIKTSFAKQQIITIYDLRLVMMSGDWIPMSLPKRVSTVFEDVEIISLGGATEASIWSVYYPVGKVEEDWNSIPYGYPLKNQKMYVLDVFDRECPVNVVGELCIGGTGLAREYYGDEEKTGKAFFEHPKYGRLYHTGDYGILHREGYIEFLGRKDSQVKVAGHRIELGEIENGLMKIQDVEKAACAIVKSNGAPQIVACVVGAGEPDIKKIKTELKEYVPAYMVPSVIVIRDEIPLTANGKVDRKKIGELRAEAEEEVQAEELVTSTEKRLAAIWRDNIEDCHEIGRNSDFYEMGGDSMKMVQISLQIEEQMGVHCSYTELINAGTIYEQARTIDEKLKNGHRPEEREEIVRVEAAPEEMYEDFELTDIQRAYLLGRDEKFTLGGISTHGYYEYETSLDLDRFEMALNKEIKSQPMLRAVVTEQGHQRFMPEDVYYDIERIDATNMSVQEQQKLIEECRNKYSHEVRDPGEWPLFVIKAILLGEGRNLLLFAVDLIIMDAASVRVFKNEIMRYYDEPDREVERTDFTFRDFVRGIGQLSKSRRYLEDEKYWNGRVADFPVGMQLPLKKEISKVKDIRCKRLALRLPPKEWNRIKKAVAGRNTSISAAICTIYMAVLSEYSDTPEVAVTMTTFNRYDFHEDVSRLIGDFTSTMLVAADFSKGDYWSLVNKVRDEILEGLEHRTYSGMEFIKALRGAGRLTGNQTIPIVFTSTLANDKGTEKDRDFGEERYSVSQTSQVYLDCQVMEKSGGLSVTWDYIEQLLDEKMMESMFESFEKMIRRLDTETDVLEEQKADEETQRLVERYNKVSKAYRPRLIHSELARWAKETPEKTAVSDHQGSYSYRELDRVSDDIAAKLQAEGVRAGDRVGVMAERRKETVANILGILKCGAAYVPVDPENPRSRQDEIIKASDCKKVIAAGYVTQEEAGEKTKKSIKPTAVDPDAAAYIIYTSGSTGKPKGVVISHRACANTLDDINERFHVTNEDKIFGLSSMCFDLSVYDIFGSLTAGAELVMVEDVHDVASIADRADEKKITVWNSVPAIMQMYMEELHHRNRGGAESLRLIMMSGDYIPLTLPDTIREKMPQAMQISLGGATEASIWSIYYPITKVEKEWKTVPYGMPLSNQSFYVLGYNGKICPIGVEGELCIGGTGLAREYYGDEEKTGKAFFEHPKYGRLYHTGDYGILHREGYIEFLGRKDSQVKVAGHRIELGEIENGLMKIQDVEKAACAIVKSNGAPQIVACVVGAGEPDIKKIKTELKGYVPAYMVPSVIVIRDEIPLTANGKVDRKKIGELKAEEPTDRITYPVTDTEKCIADLWKNNLADIPEAIGTDWNFYELGGDSVVLFTIITKIEEAYDIKLSVADMMNLDTVKDMADYVDSLK